VAYRQYQQALIAQTQAEDARKDAQFRLASTTRAIETAQAALKVAEEAKKTATTLALNTTGDAKRQATALLVETNKSFDRAANEVKQLQQCPAGRRVYPQIAQGSDAAVVERVGPGLRALAAAGFDVQRVEVVSPEKMPAKTAVRYFRPNEKDDAEKAAAVLERAGVRDVAAQFVGGFDNSENVRPCQYVFWVGVSPAKPQR
jgi:hypothetical protein